VESQKNRRLLKIDIMRKTLSCRSREILALEKRREVDFNSQALKMSKSNAHFETLTAEELAKLYNGSEQQKKQLERYGRVPSRSSISPFQLQERHFVSDDSSAKRRVFNSIWSGVDPEL